MSSTPHLDRAEEAGRSRRRDILSRLTGPRKKTEALLGHYVEHYFRDPNTSGVFAPFDFPVFIRAYRLTQNTKDHDPEAMRYSNAMVGWTLEIHAMTYGVKVFIRLGLLDGTLKVMIEDSEGITTVASYEKEQ